MRPICYGVIGTGWRADFYLRIARALPARFHVTGLVGAHEARRTTIARTYHVPAFGSLAEMISATSPDFVVSAVRWHASPLVIWEATREGVPCLSETPPAPDLEGLIALVREVGPSARVQVAEQYWLQPHHAARLALIASGKLGRVNQAQLSVAHGYHGISLIRRTLGIGFESPHIMGRRFADGLVAGPNRDGPPIEERLTKASQDFVWLDWGDRLGVLDFHDEQYMSWIRNPRVLVRGERGEVLGERVHYLKDFRTPVNLDLIRHEAGPRGNLEGNHLKGIQFGEEWVYRNPLAPAAFSDEEIAVATCLIKMDDFVRSGQPFYSLSEACQDHYLSMLSERAISEGKEIVAERQEWVP